MNLVCPTPEHIADGGTALPNLAVRIQRGSSGDDDELSTGLETTRMTPPSGSCGDYAEPDVTDDRNSESVPAETS